MSDTRKLGAILVADVVGYSREGKPRSSERDGITGAVTLRVSLTLQMDCVPRWFSAPAPQLGRNEVEAGQFLHERTRSPSTIGIVR